MTDPLPSADIVDKFKTIDLDHYDCHLLIALIVFFCGLLTYIICFRANMREHESVVSWLIAGIVALALLYVAGTRVKRVRKPKPEPAKV